MEPGSIYWRRFWDRVQCGWGPKHSLCFWAERDEVGTALWNHVIPINSRVVDVAFQHIKRVVVNIPEVQ